MTRMIVTALVAALAVLAGCSSDDAGDDPGLEGLAIDSVDPGVLVPGTRIVVRGRSFVPEEWGTSRLRLRGVFDGHSLDLELPATFVDYDRLEVELDPAAFERLGGEGIFVGKAIVEVDSTVDGLTHESDGHGLALEARRQLTPEVDELLADGVIFVNEAIEVGGKGFLLGGDEGETVAVLDGCFVPDGDTACVPGGPTDVVLTASEPFDRQHGTFRFAPEIAGIHPGAFSGTVRLENRHASGEIKASGDTDVAYALSEPAIFELGPRQASLGQFVDVEGGGFIGDPVADDDDVIDGTTLLELDGQFVPDQGGGVPVAVALTLVPEFVAGRLVRYVVSEDDQLGRKVDLRHVTGKFSGTVRPIVQWQGDEVVGDPLAVELEIAPLKQVVQLVFRSGYVESLRHFGLRALDQRIRARIADIVRRDYDTVNVDVRLEPPTDFAIYAVVEVNGADPNRAGLLGYDNTPGKDTDNLRLYDRIGGVNAVTQADGFPGFGGVFIESLFAFSEHPGSFADSVEGQASPMFDDIFDGFRPDQGGDPVSSGDLVRDLAVVDGGDCPADDRATRIACAELVLGNLIGTTLSHELGHSLGLANPYGAGFHDPFDEPNRLMDSGGARTFNERSELEGEGPARFCDDEYAYLRKILPTELPTDTTPRPTCQ